MGRIVLLSASVITLLCAIILNFAVVLRDNQPGSLNQSLATLLPQNIPGWTMRDRPVAETEEMKRAVGELLNYDDGILRVFESPGVAISVYVAYWGPGKMPPRLIASHTPDICWVGGGWNPVTPTERYGWNPLLAENRVLSTADGKPLCPARFRIFEQGGHRQHVVFWHFVDQRPANYNEIGAPAWWAIWYDLKRWGFKQRGEQLFVRISSNIPLEQVWSSEPVQRTLAALGPLGLYSRP